MNLTPSQVCEQLQVDKRILYRLIREMNLPSILVDGQRMIRFKDFDRWCKAHSGVLQALEDSRQESYQNASF